MTNELGKKKVPTPSEVIKDIEDSFESYVKPMWVEWDKECCPLPKMR